MSFLHMLTYAQLTISLRILTHSNLNLSKLSRLFACLAYVCRRGLSGEDSPSRYCLAYVAGKDSPSAKDVKKILESIEAEAQPTLNG